MLYGKEVPFSRDVENTAVELLQHLQKNRSLRSLFPFGRLHRVPGAFLENSHVGWWCPTKQTYRNGQKIEAEGSNILQLLEKESLKSLRIFEVYIESAFSEKSSVEVQLQLISCPRRACWVLDSPYWDTVLRSLVLPAEIFAPTISCRT